jgi:hypothetical protein
MDMTWKDINVFQWQQLYDLQSNVESMSEQEMSIKTIAILTNKTEQQIQDMSEKQFLKIAHKIKFLQKQFDVKHVDYIYANGKRFKCQYDVKRMPAGRYIETKHFAASFTENLHRLAATMVIPQKRNWLGIWVDQPYDPSSHEEYANDMLTAPITDVLGSVVFFCQVYRHWIKVSKDFLISEMMRMKMSKLQAEIVYQALCSVLDGFTRHPLLPNMKRSN